MLLLFLQESHGLVSSVVQCSFAQDGPLSDPESHGSVSSVLQGSLAQDRPLSDVESHVQSHLLCNAHLPKTGLSLIWTLMGQSHLLCNAHLLEMGLSLIWSLMGQSLLYVIGDLQTRKSGCTFCEHSCSSILYCLRSYPIDSSELLQLGHNYSQQWTNARNLRKRSQQWTTLTTYENAHSSKKCSHFTEMHAHNLPKILLTTLENAHNLRTCSQLIEMLTTLKNAHNLRTCSQLIEMLTTLKNAHNFQTCSQLTEMLTTIWKCSQLWPLTRNAYNTQLLQMRALHKGCKIYMHFPLHQNL